MKLFFAIFFFSASVLASNEDIDHLVEVAGGIAHPSYLGNTNPVGFIYNKGASLYVFGSPVASTWTYGGGLAYGQKTFGLGVSAATFNAAGSATAINWGLGVELSSSFGLGVSGTNGNPGIISILINPEGKHRIGAYVSNFASGTNSMIYSLGYAYEEKTYTLGLGASYSPNSSSGNGYAGIGIHGESYMLAVNYTMPIVYTGSSSGANSGAFSFGGGLTILKNLELILGYATNTYSILLNLSL